MAKTCGDIMTREVVCCVPEDTVEHAATLMKAQDVGPIPVVESHEGQRLIGILTDRDIVTKVIAESRNPKSTAVREVMSINLVTCTEDEGVDKAADQMASHKVRRIPVVDDNNRIVGIIAQADLATRVSKFKKTAEVIEKISR